MMRHNLPSPLPALLAALVLAACGGEKPEALVASAKEYLAKNDAKAAVIQVKNALQKAPDMAEARYLLGKALLDTGDATAAEVELRKALDLKHSPEQVVPPLARAMLAKGQVKRMVDEFGQTHLTTPEARAELQTLLSGAQGSLGKPEAAKAALDAALAAKVDYEPAQLLQARSKVAGGDIEAAIAVVDAVLAKSPTSAEALKLKGDLRMAQGRLDDAQGSYGQALEAKADYLPARGAMIGGLLRQGKLDEAGKQLEELKKTAPRHPQTLFLVAQLAYQKGQFAAARDTLQQLHKAVAPYPLSQQLSGAVDFRLGSYGTAEDSLAKALQGAPKLALARQLLIATYLRTGQIDKAMSTLEPVLGHIENSPAMLALAGEVHIQRGDYKKAEDYYTKATKLDPKDAAKRTRLALTRMAEGDAAGGFEQLEGIAAEDAGTSADLALIAAHLRRNELDKALKAIDGLERKLPDDPRVANMRGQVMLANKDYPSARKNFEKALSLKPSFFLAAASLAALDVADKKPEDAKRRFESVLAADPKSVQAHLALAQLHARSGGKVDQVAAMVGKAVAVSPTDPAPRLALIEAYLGGKEPKKALQAAQDALAAIPDRPELLSALGRVQMTTGDYNQALHSFNKVSGLQPRSPVPYLQMAEVQMAVKDKEAAMATLRKGLELKPDYLDGQRALGTLYVAVGKHDEAKAIARTIQKQRPKDGSGYAMEGDVAMARKAWGEAAVAYRSGLERTPVPELAIKLHFALRQGGNRQEADRQAASWLKAHPKDLAFRNYLAEAAVASRDWSGGVQQYQQLLEQQPENPVVLNNLAWAAGQMKDPKALQYAETANRLAPNQPAFMDTLGVLLAEKGETGRAAELLTKAVDLGPEMPGIRLNLAKVLIKTGNKAEARRQLDELAKLGDKFRGQGEVATLLKEL